MKALLATLACVVVAATTLPLTGCDKATAADSSITSAGKPCTVQLRGDALGAAADLLISPRTSNSKAVYTTISCTFKSIRGDWVIVISQDKEVWIPKNSILLIEFE